MSTLIKCQFVLLIWDNNIKLNRFVVQRACALVTFSSIVTSRTSGISSKFLFPLLYHMWRSHLRRAYWQFNLVFYAFIISIVVVFILLVNCLKLLSRKASILILESDSPMYLVTRFNQFLKYVVVLHLLVFLICIGLLFHSRGLIRVPDGVNVFTIKFSDFSCRHLLSESLICRNFDSNFDPFFLSHSLFVCLRNI